MEGAPLVLPTPAIHYLQAREGENAPVTAPPPADTTLTELMCACDTRARGLMRVRAGTLHRPHRGEYSQAHTDTRLII